MSFGNRLVDLVSPSHEVDVEGAECRELAGAQASEGGEPNEKPQLGVAVSVGFIMAVASWWFRYLGGERDDLIRVEEGKGLVSTLACSMPATQTERGRRSAAI